jgi:hypothetical protein
LILLVHDRDARVCHLTLEDGFTGNLPSREILSRESDLISAGETGSGDLRLEFRFIGLILTCSLVRGGAVMNNLFQ